MTRLVVFGAAAAATLAAFAEIPVSVTKGEGCEVPSFKGLPFVQEGEAAAIKVPNEGWTIDWQRECPKGSNDVTGLKVEATKVELRGKEVPAIRITCTPGKFRNWPLVALPFEVDFSKWNVFSFSAKVEYPEGVKPLMLDSTPMIGWYSASFFERWDDFGIAADDATTLPWAGNGVHTTDFKNHDYPATRTKGGFTDFRWDVPHEERTGYKGFVENRVRSLYFMYDTRKIKEGQKVVITIADMKVVKGWHKKFSEPERYAAWLKRVAEYEPDCSDSSDYLEPPETGRLGFFSRVRLAQGGVAQAEIVADVSDDVLLDKWFKKPVTDLLVIKQSRGKERQQTRAAAYALQKWLKELTGGAEFPVVERPTDPDKAKIFLGAGFAKDLFADDLKALADGKGGVDGFAVRVRDGNVYIFGAHPMGTSNGVFAFLENNTDVIWAMANDPDGTVFTPDPDLTVVWGDALEKPAFRIRGWQGGDAEWKRQNRSNFWLSGADYGFSVSGGHYLSPQYYQFCEGIQDFNAEIKGKRTKPWTEYRQLCCLADPEFPKHAWESVPCLKNIGYGGTFNCVFGTDDNCGVCECAKCTAPIKTIDGRMLTPDVDYQGYYGAWFYTYLNKLDNEIQKICPGFMTSTFAYFFACSYPPIKVNKTIVPWLCTYYRKAYNQPIYAPANQDWWKIYNDWAKHSNQIYLYDYYGLGMREAPLAEVYQEDLKAQRDIGFLATSTEGFGGNQYCGCGDERWTMARLAWNPDADVEQLHRYFNRRTYREAAPWIDRFRGVIRKNWYGNFPSTQHLNEFRETFCMINALGLDNELRGYLAEAQKAVRNPKSKKLLEKLVADYDAGMAKMGWYDRFPSVKMVEKVAKPKPVFTAADCDFTNRIAKALALSKIGNWPGAKEEFLAAAANGLVDPKLRADKLHRTFGTLVGDTLKVNAADAIKLWKEIENDDFKKAYGISLAMNGNWGAPAVINSLAQAFVRRRQPEEAAKVYDAWINWDGNKLPSGLRAKRVFAKIDFLRKQKVDLKPHLNAYLAAARDCAKNGANAQERGDAKLRLWREEMAAKSVDERLKGLFELIDDRFMIHALRASATKAIPDACTVDGKTDWARVSSEALRALAAGDWSGLWRNTYTRQNRSDTRLDVLLEIAAKMEKAEAKQIAADFIVKGATAIGYTKNATKQSLDLGGPDGFDARVKKLDEAMAKLGVARK